MTNQSSTSPSRHTLTGAAAGSAAEDLVDSIALSPFEIAERERLARRNPVSERWFLRSKWQKLFGVERQFMIRSNTEMYCLTLSARAQAMIVMVPVLFVVFASIAAFVYRLTAVELNGTLTAAHDTITDISSDFDQQIATLGASHRVVIAEHDRTRQALDTANKQSLEALTNEREAYRQSLSILAQQQRFIASQLEALYRAQEQQPLFAGGPRLITQDDQGEALQVVYQERHTLEARSRDDVGPFINNIRQITSNNDLPDILNQPAYRPEKIAGEQQAILSSLEYDLTERLTRINHVLSSAGLTRHLDAPKPTLPAAIQRNTVRKRSISDGSRGASARSDSARLENVQQANQTGTLLHGVGGPFAEIDENATVRKIHSSNEIQVARVAALVNRYSRLIQVMKNIPVGNPVKGAYNVTSRYGIRNDPLLNVPAFHHGIDVGAFPGAEVAASTPGRVVRSTYSKTFGKYVVIDHGGGVKTTYAHLADTNVKRGDLIEAGDVVGFVGNSGRSTGTHLHYEISVDGRSINPEPLMWATSHVRQENR